MSPKGRTRHTRRTGRTQRPVLWLVGGTLAAVVGGGLVATAPWAERARYLRAQPCAAGERDDCLLTISVLVVDRRVSGGRFDEYHVLLRYAAGVPGPVQGWVELPEPDPVWDQCHPGAAVSVDLWNGSPSRLVVPSGGTVETAESPVTEALENTVWGLFALTMGAVGVTHGILVSRRDGWWKARDIDLPSTGRLGVWSRVLAASFVGAVVAIPHVEVFDVYEPGPPLLTYAALTAGTFVLLETIPRRRARRASSP